MQKKIGELLTSSGASASDVARALAKQLELPFVEAVRPDLTIGSLVPLEYQREHRLVLFARDPKDAKRLHVAIDDAKKLELVDELRFQFGRSIEVFVTTPAALDDAIRALFAVKTEEPIEGEVVADEAPPVRTTPMVLPTPLQPDPVKADSAQPAGATTESMAQLPTLPIAPAPVGGEPEKPLQSLSEKDFAVLEALGQLASGETPKLESEKIKPAQMIASLIRLLIRKGVIEEAEFLDELGRK